MSFPVVFDRRMSRGVIIFKRVNKKEFKIETSKSIRLFNIEVDGYSFSTQRWFSNIEIQSNWDRYQILVEHLIDGGRVLGQRRLVLLDTVHKSQWCSGYYRWAEFSNVEVICRGKSNSFLGGLLDSVNEFLGIEGTLKFKVSREGSNFSFPREVFDLPFPQADYFPWSLQNVPYNI